MYSKLKNTYAYANPEQENTIDTTYKTNWNLCYRSSEPSFLGKYQENPIKGYFPPHKTDDCYIYVPGTGNSINMDATDTMLKYMTKEHNMCSVGVEYPFNATPQYYATNSKCDSAHEFSHHCVPNEDKVPTEQKDVAGWDKKKNACFNAKNENECKKMEQCNWEHLTELEMKSKAIYGDYHTTQFKHNSISAIRALKDNYPNCLCKNIYAHGFSQGANISTVAKNFNENVRGELLFGGGCHAGGTDLGIIHTNSNNCHHLRKDRTRIDRDNIRVISSQDDGIFGCGKWADDGKFPYDEAPKSINQIKTVAGANCAQTENQHDPVIPKDPTKWLNFKGNPHEVPCQGPPYQEPLSCKVGPRCKTPPLEELTCLSNEGKGGGYIGIPYNKTNNDSRHGWFHDENVSKSNPPLWKPATTRKTPWDVYDNLDWLASNKPKK